MYGTTGQMLNLKHQICSPHIFLFYPKNWNHPLCFNLSSSWHLVILYDLHRDSVDKRQVFNTEQQYETSGCYSAELLAGSPQRPENVRGTQINMVYGVTESDKAKGLFPIGTLPPCIGWFTCWNYFVYRTKYMTVMHCKCQFG